MPALLFPHLGSVSLPLKVEPCKVFIVKTIRSGLFLIVFGGILFVFPPTFRFFNNFYFQLYLRGRQERLNTLSDEEPIKISKQLLSIEEVVGDYPSRIIIPKLGIDLPVVPARVIGGVWEIHQNAANFGVGSALPGEVGNSVIFAHAKANLFSPIRKIRKDDLVSIQTREGHWFTYKVVEKKEVGPSQTEVIGQTTDKTLTLFTCSGFADSKRLIVVSGLTL